MTKIWKFLMVAASASALTSTTSFARLPYQGSATSGGGTAYNDETLDEAEYDPQYVTLITADQLVQLPAYQQVVKPILEEVGNKLPEFAKEMQTALQKPWYFSKIALACPETTSYLPQDMLTIVACQNQRDGRILESWFNSVNLHTQGALLIHEMARNLQLKYVSSVTNEPAINDWDLRAIVRLLMDKGNAITADELSQSLREANFGNYMTKEQESALGVAALKNKVMNEVCAAKGPQMYQTKDLFWILSEETMVSQDEFGRPLFGVYSKNQVLPWDVKIAVAGNVKSVLRNSTILKTFNITPETADRYSALRAAAATGYKSLDDNWRLELLNTNPRLYPDYVAELCQPFSGK